MFSWPIRMHACISSSVTCMHIRVHSSKEVFVMRTQLRSCSISIYWTGNKKIYFPVQQSLFTNTHALVIPIASVVDDRGTVNYIYYELRLSLVVYSSKMMSSSQLHRLTILLLLGIILRHDQFVEGEPTYLPIKHLTTAEMSALRYHT